MNPRINATLAYNKRLAAFVVVFLVSILTVFAANANAATNLRWIDAKTLTVEGKGWTDTKSFYDRLPAKAEGVVRDPVWKLGQNSAGICVRFVTDAPAISVRWTVRNSKLALSHMPASGVSGVDLYVRHHGKWHWAGAARPEKSMTTEKELISGLTAEPREFVLYLPLYNGVENLSIGLPPRGPLRAAATVERKPETHRVLWNLYSPGRLRLASGHGVSCDSGPDVGLAHHKPGLLRQRPLRTGSGQSAGGAESRRLCS